MNAVEIEEAVSQLVGQPFDAQKFPFDFLEAFGNKATTIKRLRSGASNKSDLGGVLQTGNIHLAVCESGAVTDTLRTLKDSPATAKARAKFVLATDGEWLEAEDLNSGETVACAFQDFPDHFGFFLPLAGITTVKKIRENAFDIKATSRLNKLYVELLQTNPDWGSSDRRQDMNHFMARLIFCFFAEDTDIFNGSDLFTATIEQMSESNSSNTHEVMGEIFRAMDTRPEDRAAGNFRLWADSFPYVNGGLFSGSKEVPRFSKMARAYLVHIGDLDWTRINPDIFGSMIQAVADEEERGSLGLHYTSVPNILKVLNPLFLNDLRKQLEACGKNGRKLKNLRDRMSRIRIFDPACGSGNFLVIAYKQMREIEYEINRRRGEGEIESQIPTSNFRGIELRDFPAEIARLALIIAEYQCDILYRGQKMALAEFLPLDAKNWITCGNALRLDWLSICPPTGKRVKLEAEDLYHTPLEQSAIDFENEGGETYICGNPPYLGGLLQSREQKDDVKAVFGERVKSWKYLDYVAGWFMKAADYGRHTPTASAFVTTNSICQGQLVPILWPEIFATGHEITFAYTSFKWANLASHNAGVTVAIVGISNHPQKVRKIYSLSDEGEDMEIAANYIGAYLVPGQDVIVSKKSKPIGEVAEMTFGNIPADGGHLCLSKAEAGALAANNPKSRRFIMRYYGSADFIQGKVRHCLWINDKDKDEARSIPGIRDRLERVAEMRRNAKAPTTRPTAEWPHRFMQIQTIGKKSSIIVPRVSSQRREYLPVGLLDRYSIVADSAQALYDAPLWNLAIIASRLHLVWIATVCGKLKTDIRYSKTLGWNTFPVPQLTEKNKTDLTHCAEDILLAREAHFPATIAELYNPEKMPEDLRHAHKRNDETIERIYIGRSFRNDTERLEKLFELYTQMTSGKRKARAQ